MPGHPLLQLGTPVRVFSPEGKISREVYNVCERPDRKGNVLLVQPETQAKIRMHQRRLLRPEQENVALVFLVDNQHRTTCPVCGNGFVVSKDQESIKCPAHGKFPLSWKHGAKVMTTTADRKGRAKDAKPKKRPATKPLSTPALIDFAALKKVGQLWTRSNTKFDHPEIEVKSHTLLVPGKGRRPARKLCINSYDGTWGKKPAPFDAVIFATKGTDTNGKTIGFVLKRTIEQEAAKLKKDGYILES